MKIGVFTNCYHPLINGVVGVISLLRKGFTTRGHEVYIFAPAFDTYRDEETHVYRYPSLDLTRKVKFPVAVPYSGKINRVLQEIKPDIIHTHHPFVLGPVGLRVARKYNIPLVYTFHTQYEQYAHYIPLPGLIVREGAKFFVRRFCRSADLVTTPADSAKAILESYGITEITMLPNPVDLSRFLAVSKETSARDIRKRYGIADKKLLITVGRLAPEKNLGWLLEVFRLLRATRSDVKLMIVGDGPERNSLKQCAASLGIGGEVVFTGMVPPMEVPEYLAAADAFVMTSVTEVKPLALLEAFAAGLPVVAFSIAGMGETITHGRNGLLVPMDQSAFRTELVGLLGDEKRLAEFRRAARETAKQYDYQIIADEYLKLFTGLIERK